MRTKVEVKPDREAESVVIRLSADDDKRFEMTLSTTQLLELITRLGRAHAHLVNGKKIPDFENVRIEPVQSTRWYVRPDLKIGGSFVAFQHPAYGPIAFRLKREQVAKMTKLLSNHGSITPSSDGPAN